MMALRLVDYHTYLLYKYGIPVISIIIYPFRTSMAVSPLEERSDEEVILHFTFRTLPLWRLNAEKYVQEHIVAMYALLPAMAGATAQLLDQAIDEMVEYYQHDEVMLARDLRWMGIILRRTDCVLEEEKQMIQERLSMYDDLQARKFAAHMTEADDLQNLFEDLALASDEETVRALLTNSAV